MTIESKIRDAIVTWTNQLIDVGGRNNLIFYRDLRSGTLDLGSARPPIFESLLQGKPVKISNLFPEAEVRKDVLRRVRTMHSKAREHYEEKGISTLFLACGMVTWKNVKGGTVPAAPVLLRPAEFHQRGAAQDDFDLVLTGEMEVNPILMHILKSDFAREVPQDALLDRLDGVIDTPWELEEAYSWLANEARTVPGFSVLPRMVLGNFFYAKLPMVKDLESSAKTLASHDLIAAVAGDGDARARLRSRHAAIKVDPRELDASKPEQEFLVLDADSSQNVAINLVLRGQDLIIKGPPGTGKSQTIANLISSLLGAGKKVLFVAEKRAAIDAVLHRLERAGLSDLVLNVHSGGASRRQVAENLSRALAAMGATPRPQTDGLNSELIKARTTLRAHAEAMHTVREPWGISVEEAVRRAINVPDSARTSIRLLPADLARLGPETYRAAADALRDFIELDGANFPFSAWADAELDSADAAQLAYDAVTTARHSALPRATQALRDGLENTGLSEAHTQRDIDQRVDLWRRTAALQVVATPRLFEADLGRLPEALQPASQAFSRLIASLTSGAYREARREARTVVADVAMPDALLLDVVQRASTLRSEWVAVAKGTLPQVSSDFEAIVAAEDVARGQLSVIAKSVGWEAIEDVDRVEIEGWLDALIADRTMALRVPELRRTRAVILAAGLEELLRDLTSRGASSRESLMTLEWVWTSSIIERVEFTDPALSGFDAERLRKLSRRFGKLDREHIARTAGRVRRLYAEHGVKERDEHPEEAALVKAQASRKRGHMPLRELFRSAPNALLAVKPCWAMSPLVVSQILPSDDQYFDVVIFDEASQVTPADAIPSIMRGRSVVVAGDDKQLPPTSFFMTTQPEDEAAPEDRGDEMDLLKGFESVLDSLAAIVPETRLDWHYRSQDERLIAFSNDAYYNGRLVTFPGVAGRGSLRHVLVSGSGGGDQEKSASAEVDEVVRLIIEHARERPNESLGVIAMGITHATRIEEALRLALVNLSGLDEFFDDGRDERFFVKNLERVQGDERDAIILSVGYGKGADGRLFYRFGPINLEGGERRLNVAVTRARRRMTVVSSFSGAEMDPSRLHSRGPQLLRDYLLYAAVASAHALPTASFAGGAADLADSIRDRLARQDITADAHVGSSSHAVDVGIRDAEHAERYVLAVETDGENYHAIATTRDRERLRHEQLGRLGWRHHRTWSLEWLRDPAGSTDRIATTMARVPGDDGDVEDDDPVPSPVTEGAPTATTGRGPTPMMGRYWKIDDIAQVKLAALIDWIESDGVLRTEEEVIQEAMRELKFQRRGARIDAALRAAITLARRRRKP